MGQYSEQDIIKGCQENNRVYQEHVYRQYYSLFLKICARYARNLEDAEQLLNDGFLRIFNNIRGFNGTGSFEGWMKRIMVNSCLDYLKSKQIKEAERTDYKEVLPEDSKLSLGPDAVKQLEFKELLQIIQTLPTMSKTVFNLYVFEGFSHKEIAEMLQISEGTSSWHLHKARHQLQKMINNQAEEPVYASKRI